jgi:hypothetical protein
MFGCEEKREMKHRHLWSVKRHKTWLYFILVGCIFISGFLSRSFAGALLASWNPNSETDLAGYKIYYGTQPGNHPVVIDVGDTTRHQVDNLVEGQTYYFVVTAYDQAGNESAPSVEVFASVDGPSIDIAVQQSGIGLSWQPVYSAVQYIIYRDSAPYFTPVNAIATVTETRYVDATHPVQPGVGSFYCVKAINASGTEIYTYKRIGAYNIPVHKGNNLVSLPIVPDDSTLTRVIGTQLTGGSNPVMSDKILIWDGTRYNISWLLQGTSSPLEGKWLTEAGDKESPLLVKPDMAFWILVRESHTSSLITVTGLVATGPNRQINIVKGPNFIGSSYPVEMLLENSDLRQDQVVKGSTFSAGSDKLLAWTGKVFEMTWLFESPSSAWDGKWLNESGSGLTTIRFVPGYGYVLWVKNDNPNHTWTLPNPGMNL